MKQLLLLATCLVVFGTNFKAKANEGREQLRWAVANKHEIEMAVFKWMQSKAQEATKAESSPEIEEQIRKYQSLEVEFTMNFQRLRPIPIRSPIGKPPKPEPKDPEYEAMAKRVADAKAPIAAILEKRNKVINKFREQYSVENLVSEYSTGRFDLVVDSGYGGARPLVLYHTNGEVLDITIAVIDSFEKKVAPEKPSKE